MKIIIGLILATVSSLSLAKVNIVTSNTTLAALAKEIGGQNVYVRSLARHNEDLHYMIAKPSYAKALSRTDVFVYIGMDLEAAWLPVVVTKSRNRKLLSGRTGDFDASSTIVPLDIPEPGVGRDQGDVHPYGNPHYLYDPRSIIIIGAEMLERLSIKDPSNAQFYQANYEVLKLQFENLITKLKNKFGHISQDKRVITSYHKSFSYLLDLLDIELINTVERLPGVSPNNAHLAKVRKQMLKNNVKLILQETYYPTFHSRLIANKVGAEVVTVPAYVNINKNETLITFFTKLTNTIYTHLTK